MVSPRGKLFRHCRCSAGWSSRLARRGRSREALLSQIAIVGVGAIGGVVAARLSEAGRDVVLCVRRTLDQLVVDGIDRTVKVAPFAVTNVKTLRPLPWVVVATKAHQTRDAAGWLQVLATTKTTIVILQNGVEHEERVRPYANGATLLPAVVNCRAERIAPGRIIQHTPAEINVPATDAGRALVRLCDNTALRVSTTRDFVTAAWRKLCMNVAGGAITALTGCTLGVVRRPEIAQLARELILECIVVGCAEGARLEETLADEIVATMINGPEEAGTSMLADRRLGLPLEVDARNGAVVRIGARHGIATPLNCAVTALLAVTNWKPYDRPSQR